jgi:hypothetical protein
MMEFVAPVLLALDMMPRPACTDEQMAHILARPSPTLPGGLVDPEAADASVVVDCSLRLQPDDVITKALRFVGSASSHLEFDCNGALVEPLANLRKDRDAIRVETERRTVGDRFEYDPARDVVVRNCRVHGSVRIASSYYKPGPDADDYRNRRGPDFVDEVRATSPTRIRFENLAITNRGWRTDTVYFEQGVTLSRLVESKVVHDANGLALYISAESGFNTVDNNEFHANSHNKREVMALDSTEGNVVSRNWFSGLDYGGIYLYRNCGEKGQIRYTGVRRNIIRDNIFYYSWAMIPDPAIHVGSNNGEDKKNWSCDIDAGAPRWTAAEVDPSWGWDADWEASSTQDYDYARLNVIENNRFCDKDASLIHIRNPSFNWGNQLRDNRGIDCDGSAPRPR